MKKTLLALFLLAAAGAKAQTSKPDVIASGGGFASSSSFTNSFTLGQGSLNQTFSAGTFILTQGFQQPDLLSTGMAPVTPRGSVATFPNPSNGSFFLEYDLESNAEVTVEAFNVLGEIVYSETSNRSSGHQLHPVDLAGQPDGVYFIRCTIKTAESTSTRTSKITLTH